MPPPLTSPSTFGHCIGATALDPIEEKQVTTTRTFVAAIAASVYVNALRWFERSAAHGNVHSMYSAAVMAEQGLGTSRDPKLARTMYRKAAKSGFVPAMIWVGDDYARGAIDKRDLVEAYAWLELALQSNVQEELQIQLLAKIDHLRVRLPTDRRDAARTRAMHLAELLRTRVLLEPREAVTLARSSYASSR
jgi:Sel1 repeat